MSISRRRFLQTIVVTAGTLSVAGPLSLQAARARRAPEEYFPQSVASGDPKAESVVLWTRLADDRFAAGDESLPLRLQVAVSDAFADNDLVIDTELHAFAANDGCVRVKVAGLSPRTRYYYRFIAFADGSGDPVISRTGRTRTAPAADDPVPVRFALASCQDYIGKYYNAYLPMLQPEHDDIDFLLHVGDFIYETTGDPDFQGDGGERNLVFDDEAGAIKFLDDAGNVAYMAARSLSNYRQLHATYRSDPLLQEVMEKFPVVHIWDDHEFTDDSWRDHSTYFDGLGTLPEGLSLRRGDGSENTLEQDLERRFNAEQAFLEYLPIDDEDLTLPPSVVPAPPEVRDILDKGPGKLYPAFRIFRDLRFGKLCNLVLTDYRTYRPNHPVDEEAFPGTVLFGEDAIRAKYDELFGADGPARFEGDRRLFRKLIPILGPVVVDLDNGNPSGLREYVAWADLTVEQQEALRTQLTGDYEASGFSPAAAADKAWAVLAGDLDVEYLNGIIAAYNRGSDADVAKIPLNIEKAAGEEPNPYGLTYHNLNKITLIGSIGARYALNPEWYELWRALRADETGGRPPEEDSYGEDLLGTRQETWLMDVVGASDAAWNLVASSVSSSSIIIDLENEELLPPDGSLPDSGPGGENEQVEKLRRLLALLVKILGLGTRFYVSGDHWDGQPSKRYDLHRFYREKGNVVLVSGDIHSSWINDFSTDEGHLFEFTGTSISSATFSGVLSGLFGLGAAKVGSQRRPGAPFGGFVRALREALASGRLTLDMDKLEAAIGPEQRAELKALAAQVPGLDGAHIEGLSDLIDQLLAVLDLYFFDFTHESEFLKNGAGASKIKSELVGIDSGSNGLVVVDVKPDSVSAAYLLVEPADVEKEFYGSLKRRWFLENKIRTRRFEISDGELKEV